MTDEFRGRDGSHDSALSVDLLSDLHAGVLSESEAAELWPRVQADPEARAVLEALEATSADLGSLRDEPVAPMPDHVAARLDAAIAGEQHARQQQGTTNVVGIEHARSKRRKRAGAAAGVFAVAAAVVAAIAIAVPTMGGNSETPGVAQPASPQDSDSGDGQGSDGVDGGTDGPLALTSDRNELAGALGAVQQARDFGPLGSKERLDSCMAAAGVHTDKQPEGVRPVTIDGQDAVMALYTTGKTAQFRMVAVSPNCGSDPVLDKIVGLN